MYNYDNFNCEQDYYSLLGVSQNATTKEIHKAYRNKAKIYHPDKYPLNSKEREAAEKHFKLLAVAHETLIDPVKRSAYDEQLNMIKACYQNPVIFDFPTISKEEQTKKRNNFIEYLKKAAKDLENTPETKFDNYDEEEIEDVNINKGISNEAKRSAAKIYLQQGITYFNNKQYARALSSFKNAQQLDSSIVIPHYIWSKLRYLAYKYYNS